MDLTQGRSRWCSRLVRNPRHRQVAPQSSAGKSTTACWPELAENRAPVCSWPNTPFSRRMRLAMDEHLKQLLSLGREHYQVRDFERAESVLRQVVAETDRFADVHDMLGVIAHSRGNFEAA